VKKNTNNEWILNYKPGSTRN